MTIDEIVEIFCYNDNLSFLFFQRKVQLPLLDIGSGHLDGDGVTQLEFVMMTATHQTVVAFVEVIIVII